VRAFEKRRSEVEKYIKDEQKKKSWRHPKRKFRNFYRDWVDSNTWLYRATRDAIERAGMSWSEFMQSPSKNPFMMLTMARSSHAQINEWIEKGIRDWKDSKKRLTRGLEEILAPVRKELERFEDYLTALRIIELDKVKRDLGIEDFVDPGQLEASVKLRDEVNVARPGWAKVADEVGHFNNTLLQWLEDSGAIGGDLRAKLQDMYENYVPLYKMAVLDEQGKIDRDATKILDKMYGSSSLNERAAGFIGRKGQIGQGDVFVPPIEAMIKNMHYLGQAAMNNQVKISLGRLATKLKDSKFAKHVVTKKEIKELGREELSKIMDVNNLSQEDLDALGVIWRVGREQHRGVVAYSDSGVVKYLAVNEDLWEVFRGLRSEQMNQMMKILSWSTRALRAGVTLTPDFMTRNIIRDVMSSGTIGLHAAWPWDVVAATWHVARKDDHYRQWVADGGAHASIASVDMKTMARKLDTLQRTGYKKYSYLVTHDLLEVLRFATSRTDAISRLVQFEKNLKHNNKLVARGKMTPRDAHLLAAYNSRWPSIDFQRSGIHGKNLNLLMPFFNAAIQGTDITARALFQPGRGFKTTSFAWIRAVMQLTLPSLLLWWKNHDEEWYKEQPDWLKNSCWLISLDGGKTVLCFPKPFELGLFFASLPERYLDKLFLEDEDAVKKWGRELFQFDLDGFGGVMNPFQIPVPLLSAAVEYWSGYSFLRQQNQLSMAQERQKPPFQYDEYTSELAKTLSFGKASPKKLENSMRVAFGTMTRYATYATDELVNWAKPEKAKNRPSKHMLWGIFPIEDTPVIRSFVRRGLRRSTASTERFWENKERAQHEYLGMRKLIAERAPEAVIRRHLEENILWISAYAGYTEAAEVMGKLNRQEMYIETVSSEEMSRDEKRENLDGVYYNKNEISKIANAEFDRRRKGYTKEDLQRMADEAWEVLSRDRARGRGRKKLGVR
jgi:hypothetical protein